VETFERWCRANIDRPYPDLQADLESYAQLLRKWQAVQNLVSRETLTTFWTRHALDSLQVHPLLHADERSMVDIGSGGGFPALPLAIASKGRDRTFHLIEPNGRKVSFLRTVARSLNLATVSVEGGRAGAPGDSRETRFQVVTARALADLSTLLDYAAPLLEPNGRALLHKGREHVDELREAGAKWQFDVLHHPSVTDESGVILELRNLRRR
jgi:16S rRNA (guanine527-N7)-methyltransferase